MAGMQLTQSAASVVERDHRGRLRTSSSKGVNRAIPITLAVLAVLTVFTFARMQYGAVDLLAATTQALADACAMFLQPALDPPYGAGHFTWGTVMQSAVITLAVTVVCTCLLYTSPSPRDS